MATTEKTAHEPEKEVPASASAQPVETPVHKHETPTLEKAPRSKSSGYNLSISRNALFAAAVVVGLGLSFMAGVAYQKNHAIRTVGDFRAGAMSTDGSYGPGMGMGGRYGARMGGVGTVTAISSSNITITLRSFGPDSSSSGTSKTYTINDSTKIVVDGSTGSVSDIKTGDTVFIRTSSSSNATATEIRVGDLPNPGATTQSDSGSSTTDSSTSTI